MAHLTRSTLEGLAEHEQLDLVVDGKHTGTSDTTENIGTSALEQRSDTLSGNDLATGIQGRLVFDGLMKILVNAFWDKIFRNVNSLHQKSSSYAYE